MPAAIQSNIKPANKQRFTAEVKYPSIRSITLFIKGTPGMR